MSESGKTLRVELATHLAAQKRILQQLQGSQQLLSAQCSAVVWGSSFS